jgi:hypothetical protein
MISFWDQEFVNAVLNHSQQGTHLSAAKIHFQRDYNARKGATKVPTRSEVVMKRTMALLTLNVSASSNSQQS